MIFNNFYYNILCNPSVIFNQLTKNLQVDIGQAAGLGNSYRFRFAFINQSSQQPNWVYWPDPSNSSISFGNFGPANPPQSITLNSSDYNNLYVNGLGAAVPPGFATGKDASLNTPYSNTLLSVAYGADVSGNKIPNYKQFEGFGFTSPQFQSFQTALQTSGPSWSTSTNFLNSIAYPEYKYVIDLSNNNSTSSYYCINDSADFSNYKAYAPISAIDDVTIRIPTKNQVDSNYSNFLDETDFTLNITKNGLNTTPIKAYQRNIPNYIEFNDLYFLTAADTLEIIPQGNNYKTSVNFGDSDGSEPPPGVDQNSFVGNDCSGENLTYYKLDIINSNVSDISSNWKVGGTVAFNELDLDENISNSKLSFKVSKLKSLGINDERLEGYYLGADIYDSSASNLTLNDIPDICNNNFAPYYYRLTQVYRDNINNTNTLQKIKEKDFNIIKKPDDPTNLSNISYLISNPNLNTNDYFYGNELPTNSSQPIKFQISFDINKLDPVWAPSFALDNDGLYDISLNYNPNQINGNKILVDASASDWEPSGTNTIYQVNSINLEVHYTTDYNNFKYSRDICNNNYGAGEQFSIGLQIKNNVTLTPTVSDSFIVTNDLSGNTKAWWWDFSWGPTTFNDLPTSNSAIFDIPNTMTITLLDSINPFTANLTIPAINHNQSIDYLTAM